MVIRSARLDFGAGGLRPLLSLLVFMDLPGTWWKHRDGKMSFQHASVGEISYNNYQLATTKNLNNLQWADEHTPKSLEDFRPDAFINAPVKPVFRNIEDTLVSCIKEADVVLGCMAWLTSEPILKALAEKTCGVQIVVQQEDWLRPDSSEWSKQKQWKLYQRLNGISNWYAGLNVASDSEIQPVRLSGAPKNSNRNNPRMHHKFLIFGDVYKEDEWQTFEFKCKSVWTGSFNATKNGTNSLENGLLIDSPEIAKIYWQEWRQVLMTSKTIGSEDWDRQYDDDYLRDGT